MLVAADRLRQHQLAAVLRKAADQEMIDSLGQALRCARAVVRRDPDLSRLGDAGPGPGEPFAVARNPRRPQDRKARPSPREIVHAHAKAVAKNCANRFSRTLRLAGRPMPWPSSWNISTS